MTLPDKVPAREYARIASEIGWAPELVEALALQESNADPRAIRFEGHKWRRFRFASRAAKKFDNRRNPSDMDARWLMFEEMDAVCREDAWLNPAAGYAAIYAHSFGWGQIMGFNHRLAGYENPREFLEDMKTLEGQRRAMTNFILRSPHLMRAGKAGNEDFQLLAHHWNGPAYARNRWDVNVRGSFLSLKREGTSYA